MTRGSRVGLLAAALTCAAGDIIAQTTAPQASPAVAFEAASVKPNKSGEVGGFVRRQPGGRFNVQNMPLRALITFAYQLQGNQLRGGPDWLSSERFDVVAKAEGDPPPVPPGAGPDQMMLMLRRLLAERFKLVVHWETQDLPIYALVLAREDKRLGPQLKPSTTDCAALMAGRQGAPPPPPAPDAAIQCGARTSPGRIQFGGMPLSQFANTLSGQAGRIVIDRTGLPGTWDFELTFTPDQRAPGAAGGSADASVPDPNGASIFTAVQEQLGLKLENTRAPTEVLVIDSVQLPTPD